MTKLQTLIFCMTSLLLSLVIGLLLYTHATIPQKTLEFSKTPQDMATLPDISLGPDYGNVSVIDLVGYYIDHPPTAVTTDANHEEQFGGC